jgi:hypothetical protein
VSVVLDWLKRRNSTPYRPRERQIQLDPPKPHGRAMSGKYLLLYKYLENRYANMVVLTFAEIEDLLGFALPDQARLDRAWWTGAEGHAADPNHADSWTLASRSAMPNLLARTVAFERAS